jgi:hypothetical protein
MSVCSRFTVTFPRQWMAGNGWATVCGSASGCGFNCVGAVAKAVWTQADFDAMGWHDNAVRAVALEPVPDHPGRLLDLD